MKLLFALVALCAVSIQADGIASQPPINYEIMVNDILNEMGQIAKDAAVALKHSFEEIVLEPLHQVEQAVDGIEARRNESEVCVAAEADKVTDIVDTMHKDMSSCGVAAAKTSADIMRDVNAATQQLVFGGYDVLHTYRRCQRYTNPILKSSCYARLTVKATFYMANARKSIKTIRKSTNERIPAVANDAEVCTQSAAEVAINELNSIQASIDACIAKQ